MNTSIKTGIDCLTECHFCSHECSANRYLDSSTGFCRAGTSYAVGSVCLHRGEEPPISGEYGICNVFYTHCNLQCVYCQNYQISNNNSPTVEEKLSVDELSERIIQELLKGAKAVGFVSASHMIPQTIAVIENLRSKGYSSVFVYNTNAYDTVDSLRILEPYIDVYLPDFKYSDDELAFDLSGIRHYKTTALNAIREMYRQKGSVLHCDDDGHALNGIIIRHLVLPGEIENSLGVLRTIADEISTSVHLSLMSQYNPDYCRIDYHQMNRPISEEEYEQVTDAFNDLGFRKGFIQELSSLADFNPDFTENQPFD
jgi:putative pyruvate formate lyase activating enzyme